MSIKNLVGQRPSKKVKFLEKEVTIWKLTVDQVEAIQAVASEAGEGGSGIEVLRTIVEAGVEGGDELTMAEFRGFPLDELSTLCNNIMTYSGMGEKAKGK